jgi:molybdate transport system substrate-binding protein
MLSFLSLLLSSVCGADTKLYIYAAASTRNAVDELIKQFPTQNNVQVSAVYGATSALARQIIDGAPAALFLSANKAWMRETVNMGLIVRHKNAFSNRLVVISSKDFSINFKISSGNDIIRALQNDRLAVAEVSAVPAGIYSQQTMETLNIWPALRDKLAQSANVRAALALVERGETPLGFVYQTDAKASPYVHLEWKIPEYAHDRILYPIGLHKNFENNPQAKQLFSFFSSPKGQEIFSQFGFESD